jgi:predicted transcriptional regulator
MENTRGALAQVEKAPMRSRVEIMANILNETSSSPKGLRKTRIMYRCNLTSRQLKIYLKLLNEKGFLSVHSFDSANGTNGNFAVYRITEEGSSFLKTYGDLKRRLREGFLTR